jgi:hypothetical protein|tara:strand:- start:464 stop:766 length:303 start_codon:yes stop_codon:yes gene_type:complete
MSLGREQILAEAHVAVSQRGRSYGDPEDNFERIANVWNALTENRPGVKFDAAWVAILLSALKLVRLSSETSHHDSWVDLAGYASCGGEIGIAARGSEEPQ